MDYKNQYSFLDRVCLNVDRVVRTLAGTVKTTDAIYPAENMLEEFGLSHAQQKQSAALMRINHAGEICAQALYHGQSMVSRDAAIRAKIEQAALEEGDHLHWCQQRLDELQSHTSYLNPLWYAGSFCIGMVAGMIGDKWSLGFVVETEQQVIKHLEGHLHLLPKEDQRSYKIIERMEADETKHRDEALAAGAHTLPLWIKTSMAFTAKIMVKTTYWI
jgi:ubiquinone biosynthesis monooxygenase Coq7